MRMYRFVQFWIKVEPNAHARLKMRLSIQRMLTATEVLGVTKAGGDGSGVLALLSPASCCEIWDR